MLNLKGTKYVKMRMTINKMKDGKHVEAKMNKVF